MRAILSASASQMLLQSARGPAAVTMFRGHVEALDSRLGLQGWIAGESPRQSPELELRIDGVAVMTCFASSHRPDIWTPSDGTSLSGFVFPADELLSLAARTDVNPEATLQVGPCKSAYYLTSQTAWTFADLQLLAVGDAQPDIELGIGLALPAELRRLAMLARRSFAHPVRQDSRKRVGVIEFVASVPGYGFIVGGWTDTGSPHTVATVLVADGRRYAAGLCCAMRPRADLPAGAQAFVGILSLQEKLELNRAPHWSLHFAGADASWLSSVQPLRILEAKAAFSELQKAVADSASPRGKELEGFVRGCLPWGALGAAEHGGGVRVGIDDCVIAPGFGVFIRGWVLAPIGVLVDVTARFGEAVFHLDPSSMAIGPRDDLMGSFPEYRDRLACAAVTALIRGTATPDHHGPWLLRLLFDDGSVHIHTVANDHVRRIDASYDLSRLQHIFPGFDSAAWLPELVEAVYGARVPGEHAEVHWERTASCSAAVVVAVSPVRAHQTIALENLDRHLGNLRAGTGAVVLMPSSMPAGVAATWLAAVEKRRPGIPLGMCRLRANSHPWPSLDKVLTHCGIQQFVFAGPGVLLTDAGAEAAAAWLASRHDEPMFLALETVRNGRPEIVHETVAFGWQTTALRTHCAGAAPFVGYLWRGNAIASANHLSAQPGSPHALNVGAFTSPLVDGVNQRMATAHVSPVGHEHPQPTGSEDPVSRVRLNRVAGNAR